MAHFLFFDYDVPVDKLIYLDNCCFNRPFDDQDQTRVRLETEAKLSIQDLVRSKVLRLVWSLC